MFKNYFKIAIRNQLKQKTFAFINLFGLALGMSCAIILGLWCHNELSYESHHKNAGRIYRIADNIINDNGSTEKLAVIPAMWAPTLKEEFPEVLNYVRFYKYRSEVVVKRVNNKNNFYEPNFYWADSTVFSVFTFPLLVGDFKSVLARPNTVVISQSMAQKYFGEEDPIGKQLIKINQGAVFELEVTGIMKDVPQTSHFHPDFLGSLSTFKPGTWHYTYNLPTSWTNHFYRSYILLSENTDYKKVEARLPEFLRKHKGDELSWANPFLQPIEDIHLYSDLVSEFEVNSDISYVYILGTIALLILLIASINYMNLSTARVARRVKEVGLRKTVGGNRTQLIQQFYMEALVLSAVSFMISIFMVELSLPFINQLSGKTLSLSVFSSINGILICGGFLVLSVFFSGSYPALILSGIRPAVVFKGAASGSSNRIRLRSLLVVTQFAATVFLIIAAIVVSQQLHFFQSTKPAIGNDVVLTTPLRDTEVARNYESFKNLLLQDSRVHGVSVSSHLPFTSNKSAPYFLPEVLGNKTEFVSDYFVVGHDFLNLFNIKIKCGRNFKPMSPDPGNTRQFIINESAVKALGLNNEQTIGKHIDDPYWGVSGEIIGVVEDFHYKRMHEAIGPLVIKMDPAYVRFLSVRLQGRAPEESLTFLREKWTALFPDAPFDFTFMDEDLENLYQAEEKMSAVLDTFGIAAILISCVGLLGLAALTAEQRTKEIGIRKVLGASIASVVFILTKDFTKWILIANIIAWPVAYYFMNKWLQDFAYRINISWWLFVLAGCAALVIALITISYQVIRAATANPVEALRYE